MSIEIYDPLYKSIEINENEIPVLDSEEVQRLRNIQQLGFSDLVYPNSTHTRFQHSLGVMYLSSKIGNKLNIDDNIVQCLRYAGLIHDTGHGPFSHVSEEVLEKNGIEHEDESCKVVDKLEDKIDVDTELIKNMIKGDDKYKIIAGEIDVDRMDYLKRDSHMSGLPHGEIDVKTLINNGTIDNEKGLIFHKRSIQAIENLLISRLLMTTSLYAHHTSMIAEKMMKRVLERYIKEKSIDKMKRKNDYEMIASLNSLNINYINDIMERLLSRDIYKRCVYLNRYDINLEKLRELSEIDMEEEEIEEEISEETGIKRSNIIVDLPSFSSKTNPDDILIKDGNDTRNIGYYTSICKYINTEQTRNSILGVYTPNEHRNKVRKEALNYFNINQ